MKGDHKPLPKPGTGVIGFGCTFIVVVAAGIPLLLGSAWPYWAILVAVAVVVAAIAARKGESFFERVLGSLPWWS
jgi:CDP-diglyceride synthetase